MNQVRKLCAEGWDAKVCVGGTMPKWWGCCEFRVDGANVGGVPVGVRGDVNRVGSNVMGFRGCRGCSWGRCEICVPKVSDAEGL